MTEEKILTESEFRIQLQCLMNEQTTEAAIARSEKLQRIYGALLREREWIPVSVAPEFDGEYLCLQGQVCGTLQHKLANYWCGEWSFNNIAYYMKLIPAPPEPLSTKDA